MFHPDVVFTLLRVMNNLLIVGQASSLFIHRQDACAPFLRCDAGRLRIFAFERAVEKFQNSSDVFWVFGHLMTSAFFDNVRVFGSYGE
ncbi:MAG: hypothetical protein ACI92G_000779 [Candidatus Pelagisphaera sp.]|jgi:hypothetical protein